LGSVIQETVGRHHPHPADTPAIILVHVVPGASRSEIVGLEGDILKVRVAAPPVKDKANRALVKLLAKALGIGSRQIEIIGGHRARRKTVQVRGIDASAVSALLRTAKSPGAEL
jgi:uncharacterized protein (TIGR00251 family)